MALAKFLVLFTAKCDQCLHLAQHLDEGRSLLRLVVPARVQQLSEARVAVGRQGRAEALLTHLSVCIDMDMNMNMADMNMRT